MRKYNPMSETLRGIGGGISSKRVMMFFSFLVMIFMAVLSTFYEKKIEQFIFDGFLYIVVGSLFSVASEQFSGKFRRIDSSEYQSEYDEEDIIDEPPKRNRRNL